MKETVPALLLKKLSLLPLEEVRIELNNNLSKSVIDLSISNYNNKVLILMPSDHLEESPSLKDLPKVGVLAYIKSSIELPNGNYRVVVKGLNRVSVLGYLNDNDNKSILLSTIKKIYIKSEETLEISALKKKLIELIKTYIKLNPEVSNSILNKISKEDDLDKMVDLVCSFIKLSNVKRNQYINEFDEVVRAKSLVQDLSLELEVIKLNNKLDKDIRESFEKEQKEYIIKAKINALNEELGSSCGEDDIYENKIEEKKAPLYIKDKLNKELKKYKYTPETSPDSSVIRNYIDTLLSLPFEETKEELDIKELDEELNKTHYGVLHVKDRIKEYAALKSLNEELINPVICLVGAPGVGKSTLADSVAKSLKRKFVKVSVGGLNDSTELIGHRRTYLGASPGKIISGIIKSESSNPVILIDEVDKMVNDYKGDPASVLLDILDVNQNKMFVDSYIEEQYDLSKTLFILTANDEENIPSALRDRLEILYIDSYTVYDKKDIALDYLIPNIFKKYGAKKVAFKEDVIIEIINNYTLESGVRELERMLDKLIRNIIINKVKAPKIDSKFILDVLGNQAIDKTDRPTSAGSVNILGVSPVGGRVINVQSILIPSSDGMIITGQIGDTAKENIKVAISYLKSRNYLKANLENMLHINFNENLKLDGASGSLGVAISIMSLLNDKKIRPDISFTGKMDLYGNILKVSSIKEKIITSHNSGITTIYLPLSNKDDVSLVPEFILKDLKLKFISNFEEIEKELFSG